MKTLFYSHCLVAAIVGLLVRVWDNLMISLVADPATGWAFLISSLFAAVACAVMIPADVLSRERRAAAAASREQQRVMTANSIPETMQGRVELD